MTFVVHFLNSTVTVWRKSQACYHTTVLWLRPWVLLVSPRVPGVVVASHRKNSCRCVLLFTPKSLHIWEFNIISFLYASFLSCIFFFPCIMIHIFTVFFLYLDFVNFSDWPLANAVILMRIIICWLCLQVVNSFRDGGYNTLVSTCVGEEGQCPTYIYTVYYICSI